MSEYLIKSLAIQLNNMPINGTLQYVKKNYKNLWLKNIYFNTKFNIFITVWVTNVV